MKTRHVLLPVFLVVVMTLPLMGRQSDEDTTKADLTTLAKSGLMGKPTVDATVEGFRFKVWLMTDEQHKVMMQGESGQSLMHADRGGDVGKMEMRGLTDTTMGNLEDGSGVKKQSMDIDQAMIDSMTVDTHHLMLDVTDAIVGKAVDGANGRVVVLFPSARSSSVNLKPMMKHLGCALALDEKGEYRFTVAVDVDGVSQSTQFPYAVK